MSSNNEEEVRHEDEDHIEDEDPDLYRCNICRSDEGDDDNPLVLCDKCSVCVHRECYGNPLGMSYSRLKLKMLLFAWDSLTAVAFTSLFTVFFTQL